MKDIMDLMSNLQSMQSTFSDIQDEMGKIQVEGISGGGMVKVILDGKGMITNIEIDPDLMKQGEGGVLSDLILTAHNNARTQLDAKVQEKTMEMSSNLPDILSGLKG